jgi:RNA polymerase sigma-70 factor (ECF subfamily)
MTGLGAATPEAPTAATTQGGVSWEQMGGQAPAPSLWERVKTAYRKVSDVMAPVENSLQQGTKQLEQEAKAATNMLVGMPGGIAGVGMDAASRVSDIVRGVPAKQAGRNARSVADQVNADWGKVTSALGLQRDASGSKIDELMTKGMELSDVAGTKAESATGGLVSLETMQSVRDTLLNSLGVKGLGKVPKARGNATGEALTADQAIRESKARIAQAAVDKQIADVAAGTAKAEAVDAVVKEALAKRHPLDEAFAKKKAEPEVGSSAQWDNMVRGLVEPPKMEAPQGPGLTPKVRIEEPTVLGEAPDYAQSGIAKLRAGELISAKEAKAIRQLKPLPGQEAIVNAEGKPYFQRGAADPALLKVLGLMGLGAVAGTALYNWYQSPSALSPDKASDVGLGLMGLGAAGMLKGKFEGVPEPKLLEVFRQGGREGEAAAAKIYEDTHRQLLRTVSSWDKGEGKLPVEDIVQRTYEKAFQKMKLPADNELAFRGDSSISTYLHTIAKNEALNKWDSAKRSPQTESMTVDPETGGTSAPEAYTMQQNPELYRSAEDVAATNDLGRRMQTALDKLPEHQRAIFESLEMEGLSYEETAAKLNIPIGTVRSGFSRAKENLQGSLREYKDLQAGRVDQDLLKGAGLAGGGALLGAALADDPQKGAIIGGILGLGGIALGTKAVDSALGRSTTRLMHIDPELRRGVRDMEMAASKEISAASDAISAFTKPVKKLSVPERMALDRAYVAADGAGMKALVQKHPELAAGYAKVREFLGGVESTLKDFGRFKEGLPDYLPLLVKDYKGLMATLDTPVREGLQNMLHKANVKMLKERGRELTETENSLLMNDYLLRDPATSFQPGYAKSRRLRITDETRPFYHTLEDALIHYGHAAVSDIQTAKFFGKDIRTSEGAGGGKYTNVENSIGALVNRALTEKRMTPEQAVEVKNILRARFIEGEMSPQPWLQDVRNLSGAALLGQVGSGLIQTSEALLSAYHHGIKPAADALGMVLTRRGIKPSEFGLANHVIEEVIGKRPTGQLLSTLLKVNLLATLDQVGISQNLTASFLKNKRLVETPAGIAKLTEKWAADYGPDFPQLLKELQASTRTSRTPLVDSLLYQELSDVRPTSRSEAPQLYNAHPDARMAYHLKQFMLTQADVIRRDSWDKIKTGDPKKVAIGLKNLALYATALSLVAVPANAVKNWIMGRPLELDKIDYISNFAQNFGLSRYTLDKVPRSTAPGKELISAAGAMLTPPAYSVAQTLGEGMSNPKKLVPLVPLAGRAIYNRELGGNEKAAQSKASQERLDRRNALEARNPALKLKRLQRDELRKRKAALKARSTQ